jgi:hypothetical protein
LTDRVASCVWLISGELVLALDEHLGEPLDTYVNGSQVWLRDDETLGTSAVGIEWRLHPVAGYRRPAGSTTEEVFAATVYALRSQQAGASGPADAQGGVGRESVESGASEAAAVGAPSERLTAPETLWAGLEAFPCDGDEIEPAPLATACAAVLGIAPQAFGIVDHAAIADLWERSLGRDASVTELLLQQLDAPT